MPGTCIQMSTIRQMRRFNFARLLLPMKCYAIHGAARRMLQLLVTLTMRSAEGARRDRAHAGLHHRHQAKRTAIGCSGNGRTAQSMLTSIDLWPGQQSGGTRKTMWPPSDSITNSIVRDLMFMSASFRITRTIGLRPQHMMRLQIGGFNRSSTILTHSSVRHMIPASHAAACSRCRDERRAVPICSLTSIVSRQTDRPRALSRHVYVACASGLC